MYELSTKQKHAAFSWLTPFNPFPPPFASIPAPWVMKYCSLGSMYFI